MGGNCHKLLDGHTCLNQFWIIINYFWVSSFDKKQKKIKPSWMKPILVMAMKIFSVGMLSFILAAIAIHFLWLFFNWFRLLLVRVEHCIANSHFPETSIVSVSIFSCVARRTKTHNCHCYCFRRGRHCTPILWLKWGVGRPAWWTPHKYIPWKSNGTKKWKTSSCASGNYLPFAGKPIFQSVWSRWMKLFCSRMQFSVK